MKIFLSLVLALIIAGCSAQEKLTPSKSGSSVSDKKLTMRQIDSITAASNYPFTQHNKPGIQKKERI